MLGVEEVVVPPLVDGAEEWQMRPTCAASAAARNSSRRGCPHHTLMPPAALSGQRRQTHAVHTEQRRRTMAGERERRELLRPVRVEHRVDQIERCAHSPRDARRAWPRRWRRRRVARSRTCSSATCRRPARAGGDDRRCRRCSPQRPPTRLAHGSRRWPRACPARSSSSWWPGRRGTRSTRACPSRASTHPPGDREPTPRRTRPPRRRVLHPGTGATPLPPG